jgi:hypothetical protein
MNPFPILILISIVSIASGLFFFLRPGQAIEFQRRFYEKINWRIEPISIPKELRNTRLMGIFLILLALSTIIFALTKF